jgi:hypothetical protein
LAASPPRRATRSTGHEEEAAAGHDPGGTDRDAGAEQDGEPAADDHPQTEQSEKPAR